MSEYIVTCDEETAAWIGNDVDSMRPIVRCRDFEHYTHSSWHRCDLYSIAHEVEPDGFCAWGVRKESGE